MAIVFVSANGNRWRRPAPRRCRSQQGPFGNRRGVRRSTRASRWRDSRSPALPPAARLPQAATSPPSRRARQTFQSSDQTTFAGSNPVSPATESGLVLVFFVVGRQRNGRSLLTRELGTRRRFGSPPGIPHLCGRAPRLRLGSEIGYYLNFDFGSD